MKQKGAQIQAVMVNHNTSAYVEMALRSLYCSNDFSTLDFQMTVLDNESNDEGLEPMKRYLASKGGCFLQTGYDNKVDGVKHAGALEMFVRQHDDGDYLMFMDSDIWFQEANVVTTLVQELGDGGSDIYACQPQIVGYYDGVTEGRGCITAEGEEIGKYFIAKHLGVRYKMYFTDRASPVCCLIKNTPVFRQVADTLGFGALWGMRQIESEPVCEDRQTPNAIEMDLHDTCSLVTHAMKTHGYDYMVSSKKIIHFKQTVWDSSGRAERDRDCHRILRSLRMRGVPDPSHR